MLFKNAKKLSKQQVRGIVVILLFLLLVVIYQTYLGFQSPKISISEDNLRIGDVFYNRIVPFSKIESITLVEKSMNEIGYGVRIGGYSMGNIQRGNYTSGYLFVYASSAPTIEIARNGETNIYISVADSMETRRLYDELNDMLVVNP